MSHETSSVPAHRSPGVVPPHGAPLAEDRLVRVLRLARFISGAQMAMLALREAGALTIKAAEGLELAEAAALADLLERVAAPAGEVLIVADRAEDARLAPYLSEPAAALFRCAVSCPVRAWPGQPLGWLTVLFSARCNISLQTVDSLLDLAGVLEDLVATLPELVERESEMAVESMPARRTAAVDTATDTWNRCGFVRMLDGEMARAGRERRAMGLLMIGVRDAHWFETGGSGADGYDPMRPIAKRIVRSLRPYDVVGRADRHQFLAALPDCNRQQLVQIARRIIHVLREQPLPAARRNVGEQARIGAVVFDPQCVLAPEELVRRAEKAYILASRQGEEVAIYAQRMG